MRRALLAALLVMLVVGPAHSAAAAEDGSTTRVLVQLDGLPGVALDQVLDDLADADVSPRGVTAFASIPWLAVELPTADLPVLEASDGVRRVQPVGVNHLDLDTTIPLVGADQLVAAGVTGATRTVAVLDTGVQPDHPFLAGRIVAERCYSHGDCGGGASRTSGAGTGAPCSITACRHGTHVAGIAAGAYPGSGTGPQQGVAPGANIASLRVFTVSGNAIGAFDDDLLAALDWVHLNAATLGIASVNLSLGDGADHTTTCDSTSAAYKTMFDQLRTDGVAPVVAAGNEAFATGLSSPACVSSAISVAATQRTTATPPVEQIASFSNLAPFVTLGAPGVSIRSSLPNSTYGVLSGTSMATPFVAGAFALLESGRPDATFTTVLNALRTTGAAVTERDMGSSLPPASIAAVPRIDLVAADNALSVTPTAPLTLTATPTDGQVALHWSVPRTAGQTAITGYDITRDGSPEASVGPTIRDLVVTGLTNGAAHVFAVKAVNSGGSSLAASLTAASATVPDAPTAVLGTPGINSVDLTWSAPAQNGGAPITAYRVTPSPLTTPALTATGTTFSFAGLTPGVAYSFQVEAQNARGFSVASSPSALVTPLAAAVGGGGGGSGGGGGGGGGATPTTTTTTTAKPATTTPTTVAPPPAPVLPPSSAVAVPGGVLAVHDGIVVTLPSNAPPGTNVAAAAATPSGGGAWVVTPEGRVLTVGDAPDLGSITFRLNRPIVGMASTVTGRGFWLLGSDGGIFSFGDAAFHGSTGNLRLNQPVVGLASTPSGKGYWLVATDGGVFSFGDAAFHGSTGNIRLNQPVASMASTASGKGYWLVARDGGVFTFGDAVFLGAGGAGHPVRVIVASPSGKGYWLLASDGAALAFGDALKP